MFPTQPQDRGGFPVLRPDLWAGLAYLFAYRNGRVVDLLSRRTPSTNSTSRAALRYGVGVTHSGRAQFAGAGLMNPGTGGFTLATFANPASGGRTQAVMQRIASGNEEMGLRANATLLGADSAGRFGFMANSATAGGAETTSACDGNWHLFAGRRAVDGACSLWIDGINRTTSSTATTDSFSSGGTFVLGGLPGVTTIQYLESKLLDAGWNRALSDAELRELGRDPFLLLRQREFSPAVYFIPASGFQAAWARGSNVILGTAA